MIVGFSSSSSLLLFFLLPPFFPAILQAWINAVEIFLSSSGGGGGECLRFFVYIVTSDLFLLLLLLLKLSRGGWKYCTNVYIARNIIDGHGVFKLLPEPVEILHHQLSDLVHLWMRWKTKSVTFWIPCCYSSSYLIQLFLFFFVFSSRFYVGIFRWICPLNRQTDRQTDRQTL